MADRWSGLLVPAALLAYLLPWVVNPGAALTPGAYDLAEWVSLTPMARGQSPVLLTPLLLRLPLLILLALLALHVPPRPSRWRSVPLLLLVVAQLPPLEFLAQRDDLNYRQQAALAAAGALLLLLSQTGRLYPWRQPLSVALCLAGAGVALVGWQQALEIMRLYQLPAQPGAGAPLLAGLLVGAALWLLRRRGKANGAADGPPRTQ